MIFIPSYLTYQVRREKVKDVKEKKLGVTTSYSHIPFLSPEDQDFFKRALFEYFKGVNSDGDLLILGIFENSNRQPSPEPENSKEGRRPQCGSIGFC